ncbi:MAG: hypothetical protein KGL39_51485 [Patescibacteria group bacterium]|nr:hypothetical protein [Patescibacteria group bacterium]
MTMSGGESEGSKKVPNDGPWFYLSFVQSDPPKGDQFVGGCYVQAPTDVGSQLAAELTVAEIRHDLDTPIENETVLLASVIAESHRLGINPGGEVSAMGPIPDEAMDQNVPAAMRNRLLAREELER